MYQSSRSAANHLVYFGILSSVVNPFLRMAFSAELYQIITFPENNLQKGHSGRSQECVIMFSSREPYWRGISRNNLPLNQSPQIGVFELEKSMHETGTIVHRLRAKNMGSRAYLYIYFGGDVHPTLTYTNDQSLSTQLFIQPVPRCLVDSGLPCPRTPRLCSSSVDEDLTHGYYEFRVAGTDWCLSLPSETLYANFNTCSMELTLSKCIMTSDCPVQSQRESQELTEYTLSTVMKLKKF